MTSLDIQLKLKLFKNWRMIEMAGGIFCKIGETVDEFVNSVMQGIEDDIQKNKEISVAEIHAKQQLDSMTNSENYVVIAEQEE